MEKILWSRKWQLTPVVLPGKFHGQRSLVGYSPWGREESDTAKRLTLSLFPRDHLPGRLWKKFCEDWDAGKNNFRALSISKML